MRLLTSDVAQKTDEERRRLGGELSYCLAHRCMNHRDVPPMNMAEGNGSSECGACAAEEFGAKLAEQALALQEEAIVFPILEGYAARLTHHAVLLEALQTARLRLDMLSPGAGSFLNTVLDA